MHILSLVTDNNPSSISGREENGHTNYFMINLHSSMGPGQDQTRDPRICSQTCICSQCNIVYMPTFGVWDSDLGSESRKLALFYQFGFHFIRMYCLLGRLVLEGNNGLVSTNGFHEIILSLSPDYFL